MDARAFLLRLVRVGYCASALALLILCQFISARQRNVVRLRTQFWGYFWGFVFSQTGLSFSELMEAWDVPKLSGGLGIGGWSI